MKKLSLLSAILVSFSPLALAGDMKGDKPGGKHAEPSAEQRTKMAEHHEKMATCLRSSRPFSECHDEMKKMHEAMGHGGGCPMADGGTCPMEGKGKDGAGHHGHQGKMK